MAEASPQAVPAAWVTAGLEAAVAHHKRQRDAVWVCPSSGDVAAIIAAVTPLIMAAEFERIRELAERCQAVGTAPDGRNTYFTRIMAEEAGGE